MPSLRLARLSLVFVLALTLTLLPKLPSVGWETDEGRLQVAIVDRLRQRGFAVAVADDRPLPRVVARRGTCVLNAWSGEHGRELRSVLMMAAQVRGPLLFGYRDRWTPTHLIWPELVRDVVNWLPRFGITLSRPASIALVADPACGDVRVDLDGLRVWPVAIRAMEN